LIHPVFRFADDTMHVHWDITTTNKTKNEVYY